MSTSISSEKPVVSKDLYKHSFKYFRRFSTSSSSSLFPGRRKEKSRRHQNNNVDESLTITANNLEKGDTRLRDLNDSSSSRECKEESLISEDSILIKYPTEDEASIQGYLKTRNVNYDPDCKCECYKMWGLQPPDTWKVMELTFPSGLIVIKNPFTTLGQRYWISRTLLDFPHHPDYVTNMDNLNRLEKLKKGESVNNLSDFKLGICNRDFYQTLRWVTFGYHHDWDTKVYSERMRSTFPEDLADMTRYISQILGFENFEAEAAIANYYHMDSTLSGHVDRSEVNQYAPLFSMSFGQSCIFLIGGKTKEERPQPVLLQSGDIAIMSGESRLSYHGVPAIISAKSRPWLEDEQVTSLEASDQGTVPVQENSSITPSIKRAKMDFHNCESFKATLKDLKVSQKMKCSEWTSFLQNYINESRINLNIRQVLFPGQNYLPQSSDTNTKIRTSDC